MLLQVLLLLLLSLSPALVHGLGGRLQLADGEDPAFANHTVVKMTYAPNSCTDVPGQGCPNFATNWFTFNYTANTVYTFTVPMGMPYFVNFVDGTCAGYQFTLQNCYPNQSPPVSCVSTNANPGSTGSPQNFNDPNDARGSSQCSTVFASFGTGTAIPGALNTAFTGPSTVSVTTSSGDGYAFIQLQPYYDDSCTFVHPFTGTKYYLIQWWAYYTPSGGISPAAICQGASRTITIVNLQSLNDQILIEYLEGTAGNCPYVVPYVNQYGYSYKVGIVGLNTDVINIYEGNYCYAAGEDGFQAYFTTYAQCSTMHVPALCN